MFTDKDVIMDAIISVLSAGRDTTAFTLTFAMYMLTQHQDVCQKLREEILAHVGSHGRPTYEHVKEMKYLRAFLNETLRLYPTV
jgi:cytochrome P450